MAADRGISRVDSHVYGRVIGRSRLHYAGTGSAGLLSHLEADIDDEPLHVVVDSTGLKVFGEGEWKVRQHSYSKRRTWQKLHVALDTATGQTDRTHKGPLSRIVELTLFGGHLIP